MGISVSPLSLNVSAHLRNDSSHSQYASIKSMPTTKSSSLDVVCRSNYSNNNLIIHPKARLCGRLRCFKPLSNGQGRRFNSFQACTQVGDDEVGAPHVVDKDSNFGYVWLKFVRPYSIIGIIVAYISEFTRVLTESQGLFGWSLLIKASPAGLVAFMCWNAYFINRIYEVDISHVHIPKLNKRYLEIAAGEVSVWSAWLLVIFYLLSGLAIVVLNTEPLITTLYCLGLLLGTIYSLPPITFNIFSSSLTHLLLPPMIHYRSGIIAFATKFGVRKIVFLGTCLLLLVYIGAISTAICIPQDFNCNFMVPIHITLALWLLFKDWILDHAKKKVARINGSALNIT